MTDDKDKSVDYELIKKVNRRNAIIRLIIIDGQKSSTRVMAQRLLDEEDIKADKSTVNRDYRDPKFKIRLRDALLEVFKSDVIYHAADNVASAIAEGNLDVSEKLLDRIGFYPPLELGIRGRIDAPGDTEEKELLDMLTSEGGIEKLKARLDELRAMPDEDPPEPKPDTDSE